MPKLLCEKNLWLGAIFLPEWAGSKKAELKWSVPPKVNRVHIWCITFWFILGLCIYCLHVLTSLVTIDLLFNLSTWTWVPYWWCSLHFSHLYAYITGWLCSGERNSWNSLVFDRYHTDPFSCDCIWLLLYFNTWTSWQETGRGGRDNKICSCILFFRYEDKQSAELVLRLKVVPNSGNDKLKGDRQKNAEKNLRNVIQYATVRRSDGCRYSMLASSVALK